MLAIFIMPYRRHNNSANTKLGCHNLCQSKRIPYAHPIAKKWGASIFVSSSESASTTSNQEHSDVLMPDQASIILAREATRPTVETDGQILTNCENQSSPTNSINNVTCVSDNVQKQLDMLSPYQLENLASLVNGDLVLLERKYRAIPNLELWERLICMCLLNCFNEMVRDLGGHQL